jgi:hypothetical protein
MAYINTLNYVEAEAGATEIYIPRYTPLNPLEAVYENDASTSDITGLSLPLTQEVSAMIVDINNMFLDSDGNSKVQTSGDPVGLVQTDTSKVADFASGVVDTSHAIKAGQKVFSASNGGIEDSTKVLGTEIDGRYTIVKLSKPLASPLGYLEWLTFDKFQNAVNGKKFSFSKHPVPTITDELPLFDIVSGQQLVDDVGFELITDTEVAVSEVANKANATSVALPSVTTPGAPSVRISERFPSTTETSTSLLGVPRAEQQLSLFADVSTLGLDEDNWEVFSEGGGASFGLWDSRESELYGPHFGARFREQIDQQALELGAFPVPYSYPFGPRYANQGLYNEDLYNEYSNFIRLGNILYDYFGSSENVTKYGPDFKDRFLDPEKVTLDSNNDTTFLGGISESEGFGLIDRWTRTWVDINDGILSDPSSVFNQIDPAEINEITGSTPLFSSTRPGYSASQSEFAYLQSKETYRYQPGRISGFTFGVKASSDSGSNANIIEWGITNPTDQYVFQLRGSTVSIVRRSTIPLETQVLEDQGLDPTFGQELKPSGDPYDTDPDTGEAHEYYTIEISRDNWNIDPLNGNGPSGYLLVPDEVTMYKIEFSWYGAIGAKFYVYVPVKNGEARWVHVHTLVIENKLGQPCLEDPNFRFRYALSINDTSRIRSPQFVYKYGASCYIDGGDEGTLTPNSYLSDIRSISSGSLTSLMGVYPKSDIINQSGYSKPNKKTILPRTVNVTSSEAAQVRVGKCRACPGFGHNYNLGLKSSESGRLANFRFLDDTLSSIEINPNITNPTDPQNELFQLQDNDSKIIVDGIYSTYLEVDEDSAITSGETIIGYRNANLKRIVQRGYTKDTITSTSIDTNPSSGFDSGGIVVLGDGSLRNLFDYVADTGGGAYPDQMRISRFSDAIAGSVRPLYGSQIDIQFLNPQPRDDAAFAEFMVGVTDKRPFDDNGVLRFEFPGGETREDITEDDALFGEYTQSTTSRDRLGRDTGETNYSGNSIFEIDDRIPRPPTEDSTDKTGDCSVARVFVQEPLVRRGTFRDVNPETGQVDGFVYLELDPGTFFPQGSIQGGEIGIDGVGTGVTLTSEETRYETEPGTEAGYASISGFPAGYSAGDSEDIEFTPIRFTARGVDVTKVFQFNPYPLYAFVKMRDNSAINSISLKEQIGDTSTTLTPSWVTSGGMSTDTSGGRAVPDLAPTSFVGKNQLDAAQIDTQCAQRLRPLQFKDSFYVGKSETISFDLTGVYNFDREAIIPDLLNTEATFFVAEPIDAASGEVQITLNTVEQ